MGTGMAASSGNFRTHLGRVIRDLFRIVHAARHDTEALVYSDYIREAIMTLLSCVTDTTF